MSILYVGFISAMERLDTDKRLGGDIIPAIKQNKTKLLWRE
jgi:hypothetical protein